MSSKSKDIKIKLNRLFKSCLNILRDNEHLTGDKALRTLGYLLILRLIEPKLDSEIDFKNYDYGNNINEEQLKKLLKYTKFSNLLKNKEENVPKIMDYLWDIILSQHPKTKKIYINGQNFNIKNQHTYIKLIKKLNKFNFEKIDVDIQGEAYEEVIKDVMVGKVFGQYFTPPEIKNIIVNIVKPKVFDNGTIETIFDPAMGTGGFLISSLRYLTKKANENKIKLDWKFISEEGLGGKEIEPYTYQLARSNMLISSGHMFDNLVQGDSIRNAIKKKYDIIMANPPFGIKGLNYSSIKHDLKEEYLPIKTNSALPLFIQAIIYILKIGGRCCIVVPNGQDLYGTRKTLVAIREFLMKTCNLKKVIYLPSGMFTYTSIKTCILYFTKKRDGKKVLKSTNQRNYEFSKKLKTKNVQFYEYDTKTKENKFLIEVPINKIVENNYVLSYSNYIEEEKKEEYDRNIEYNKLENICNFKRGKQLSKKKFIKGNYPVIGGGKKPVGYHNEYNMAENSILCSSSGSAGYISRYNKKIWASDCFSMMSSDESKLDNNYLYYYLKFIQEDIYKLKSGTAQPHVYIKDIKKLEIPVPSIEIQKRIVKQLDLINIDLIDLYEKKIIKNDELIQLCLKVYTQKNVECKKLENICDFKRGKQLSKKKFIEGNYPVIGGGKKPVGYHNEYNMAENSILCSSSGSAGYISRYNKKIWASDCFSIISSDENKLDNDYLYYYLKFVQEDIYQLKSGTAQPHVYIKDIKNLEIPVPSIEIQKNIVKQCDHYNKVKEILKEEFKHTEKLAKDIFNVLLNN